MKAKHEKQVLSDLIPSCSIQWDRRTVAGNVFPLCLLSPISPFRAILMPETLKSIQGKILSSYEEFCFIRVYLPIAGSVTSMAQTFKREIPYLLPSFSPFFSALRSDLKPEIFYIINPLCKILIAAHDDLGLDFTPKLRTAAGESLLIPMLHLYSMT